MAKDFVVLRNIADDLEELDRAEEEISKLIYLPIQGKFAANCMNTYLRTVVKQVVDMEVIRKRVLEQIAIDRINITNKIYSTLNTNNEEKEE